MFTLFCILLILKLIGLITIGWAWVFLPLIVVIAWNVLTLIVAAVMTWFVNR